MLSDEISAHTLDCIIDPDRCAGEGTMQRRKKKVLCRDGEEELWDCLSKHEAELGAPCKTKIEARAKAKKERAVPSAAPGANYSSPSTDTQPQPSYPDGKTQ